MHTTRLPVRVYIEDTDAGGIVYYVNYLKFLERARTEFLRELGYGKAAMFADKLMFVVHSLQTRYRAPAQLDDELCATAAIKKAGRAAVVFEQQVLRGDELLCEGEVKVACVSRVDRKPVSMPAELIKKLQAS